MEYAAAILAVTIVSILCGLCLGWGAGYVKGEHDTIIRTGKRL